MHVIIEHNSKYQCEKVKILTESTPELEDSSTRAMDVKQFHKTDTQTRKKRHKLSEKKKRELGIGHNLGDEYEVAFGLADAAAAIVAYETEASDARGADLPVQTGSVGDPFQRLCANSTTVIHLFSSPLDC